MNPEADSMITDLLGSFTASSLIASIVVSAIGFVAFSYGKKMSRAPQMVVGILLMGFPYFVHNVWAMGVITVLLLGALYGVVRLGL